MKYQFYNITHEGLREMTSGFFFWAVEFVKGGPKVSRRSSTLSSDDPSSDHPAQGSAGGIGKGSLFTNQTKEMARSPGTFMG